MILTLIYFEIKIVCNEYNPGVGSFPLNFNEFISISHKTIVPYLHTLSDAKHIPKTNIFFRALLFSTMDSCKNKL